MIPVNSTRNVISAMVMPDLVDSVSILRSKHSVSLRFLSTQRTVRTSIAAVVVLIPPAVPAGEPPTNIRIHPISLELSSSPACDTVAYPAVLVVTDWNIDAMIFWNTFISFIVAGFSNSIIKKHSVPKRIKLIVMTITIRL